MHTRGTAVLDGPAETTPAGITTASARDQWLTKCTDAAANALSSTANLLRAHGWRAGAGYQPGEANFAAIEAWNAAPVYQKAIALMGRQIDGGGQAAER